MNITNIHPSRRITDHRSNELNEKIEILAIDQPGPGGANHEYRLGLAVGGKERPCDLTLVDIQFQNGPIHEVGVNGLTNEALLAIVIDRMRGFQGVNPDIPVEVRGKYSCLENANALMKLEEAMMWLQKRTRDRVARGVEGTSTV